MPIAWVCVATATMTPSFIASGEGPQTPVRSHLR